MKLDLKALPKGSNSRMDFAFELDFSQVALWGENPFKEPVPVAGHVECRAEVLTMEYEVKAKISTVCGRCLSPVEMDKAHTFRHVVTENPDNDGETEYIYAENGKIDAMEVVLSDLLLELPLTVACGADCKGLCPRCGANLNQGDCGCPKGEPDLRFDILRKLLEQ